MSLNIGTGGVNACQSLRGNPDWSAVREALRALVTQKMNLALDAPQDKLADHVGYTRALRDIYVAFESATTGDLRQITTEKPSPAKPVTGKEKIGV